MRASGARCRAAALPPPRNGTIPLQREVITHTHTHRAEGNLPRKRTPSHVIRTSYESRCGSERRVSGCSLRCMHERSQLSAPAAVCRHLSSVVVCCLEPAPSATISCECQSSILPRFGCVAAQKILFGGLRRGPRAGLQRGLQSGFKAATKRIQQGRRQRNLTKHAARENTKR
jgi:hypothetical protein